MGIVLLAIVVIFNPPSLLKQWPRHTSAVAAFSERTIPSLSAHYPQYKIVINIPATELRLYEEGKLLRAFPIAVGQRIYPTPIGRADALSQIIWNPWWYPPESEWAKDEKITPPGPNNPLGVVKMPLSDAILMHGTNKERSIGTPASHACIRMLNEDAKSLAWILQSGLTDRFDPTWLKTYEQSRFQTFLVKLAKEVPVEFIYEPLELTEEKLLLHRDIYGKIRDKKEWLQKKLSEHGLAKIDSNFLEEAVKQWQQAPLPHLQLSLENFQSHKKSEPASRLNPAQPSPPAELRHESL